MARIDGGQEWRGPIAEFDAGGFLVRFASEVKEFDPLNYVEKKEARKMGAFTHYAIAASDQALADSGLKITPESPERVGTYSNSGLGDFWGTEKYWASFVPAKVDISTLAD